MSKKIEPSLESITVRGKYKIPETDFSVVSKTLGDALATQGWGTLEKMGESLSLMKVGHDYSSMMSLAEEVRKHGKSWSKYLQRLRKGITIYFLVTTVEHYSDGIIVEVECRPVMWYLISQKIETSFTENAIQEALLECKNFVKRVMSLFRGKEIEPVSVYPIIKRAEIKSRLLNLGLKKVVDLLNKAEKHIVQNNFEASLASSRTAFEKMVDWQIEKRGLKKTSSYRNDLDRMRSKGYLDIETADLLKSYYRCLSNIGVHEKGKIPVGIFEAQMGYGTTLIMLDYFANKLP